MKRLITIAGLIIALMAVFVGTMRISMHADKPEVIIKKLRRGKGDTQELLMKLNLARGDIVPKMLDGFEDANAPISFRLDMLEQLLRRYSRASDQRILLVLESALKNPDKTIRLATVKGINLYGQTDDKFKLIPCVDDDDTEVVRTTLLCLSTMPDQARYAGINHDRSWTKLDKTQRQAITDSCTRLLGQDQDDHLRYLARSVLGREIEFLCTQARQTLSASDIDAGEKLLRKAIALDPTNHQAQISLVRYYLSADMKDEAFEAAKTYGGITHIPLLKETPVIDGDPTEAAWDSAFRYEGKPGYNSATRWASKVAEGDSDFYVGHRDGTIYIAVLGYEDDLHKLQAKHKGRDSDAWRDDCAEIFIDPSLDGTEHYQFVINALGTLMDSYKLNSSDNMPCQWAAKVFYDRKYWGCEFAVAAKDLHKRKMTADTIWGFNIFRTRIGGGASEQCAYWPTFGRAHRFHLWPLAVFEGLENTTDDPNQSPSAAEQ